MSGWRLAARDLVVEHSATAPVVHRELGTRIEGVWQAEMRRRPALFDGEVFAVAAVEEDDVQVVTRLRGCFVPYRWYVASRADAGIRRELDLRFTGVSGVLECPDGVVIGRRGRGTADEGRLELIPSGTLDRAAATGSRIDVVAHAIRELREEAGMTAADLTSRPLPFAFVEDSDAGICDVGIHMHTAIPASEVVARHGALGSREYDELFVQSISDVRSTALGSSLLTTSHLLLAALDASA